VKAANAFLKTLTPHYYALVISLLRSSWLPKNTIFLIDSGLVPDLETQKEVFDTVHATCSDLNGFSSQNVAQVLF